MARFGPRSATVIERAFHGYKAADLDAGIGVRNLNKPRTESAEGLGPQTGLRFRQPRRLRQFWLGIGSINVCAIAPAASDSVIVSTTITARNLVQPTSQ